MHHMSNTREHHHLRMRQHRAKPQCMKIWGREGIPISGKNQDRNLNLAIPLSLHRQMLIEQIDILAVGHEVGRPEL